MRNIEKLPASGLEQEQKPEKKKYVSPALTRFGAVSSLTASGSGGMAESYTLSSMTCDNANNKSPCVIP